MPVAVISNPSALLHAKWKGLTDQWNACLAIPPKLDYFKMTDAMSFADQFSRARGWTTKLRDERVCAFYEIIRRHVEGAVQVYCR